MEEEKIETTNIQETLDEQSNGPIVEPAEIEKPNNGKKKKGKEELTSEQKRKKKVNGLIITASIVIILALFFSICSVLNNTGITKLSTYGDSFEKVEYTNQLKPLKDSDGYYVFTTDNDFKVIQITDVHIGGGCFSNKTDKWAMDAVATMIRQEKPDLVVVTGDIAYPVPFFAGTFNNLNATRVFANMMEKLGVYWTFTFGNHDTEAYSMYTREDICQYYENSNFKYCLFQRGFSDEEKGYGNTIIKVKNSAGVVTKAIVTLDSHSYIDGDILGILWKYDNLHQSQVDWYASEMDKITAANQAIDPSLGKVKNIAFFHIPLVELRDAYAEYLANNSQDTEDVKYIYGKIDEPDTTKKGVRNYGMFPGIHEDNFFETGLEYGLQACFFGHDHKNNLSLTYKGIRLTYGKSIDYLAYIGIYKVHEYRGCTQIIIKTDSSLDITPKSYYDDYNVEHEAE